MPHVLAIERDQAEINLQNPDGVYRHVLALTENEELASRARAEVMAAMQLAAAKESRK